MMYKVKLDVIEKMLPHYIQDEAILKIFMNIVTKRKGDTRFSSALFKADAHCGGGVAEIVENYEDDLDAKKAEAEKFSS